MGDPQCNVTKAYTEQQQDNGLYELLIDEVDLKDIILRPYDEKIPELKNIYLLPSNYNLFLYEKDSSNPNQIFELKNKLKGLDEFNFDYVLVDTNPSLSFILTSIYTYVQSYIAVFDISNDALDGFRFLEENIIKNIKKNVNHELTFKGIIINNKNRETTFNTQFITAVKRMYGKDVFNSINSTSVAAKESRLENIPLISYLSKHQLTLQYADLTGEFIKRIGSDE